MGHDIDICAALDHARNLGYKRDKLKQFMQEYSMGSIESNLSVSDHPVDYPMDIIRLAGKSNNQEEETVYNEFDFNMDDIVRKRCRR